MLRKLSAISVVLPLMLSLFACERVDVEVKQTGCLDISLQQDLTEYLVFKSEDTQETIFAVTIYDSDNNVVAAYDDHREIAGEPLELPVGTYKITASSVQNGAAAFDSPFYFGEQETVIKSNTMSDVTLTAYLANVKVTATFSDAIRSQFEEYILTVTNGEGTLIYSNVDDTIDNVGYFSATGTLTWTLALRNIEGEEYEVLTDTYEDVQPRQHYNLQFDLQDEDAFGGTSLKVGIDDSTKDKTYNLLLDFEADVRPTVTASFDMFQTFKYAEGENVEAKFAIKVPGGFKSAVISHANSTLSGYGLPYRFSIMDLSFYDRTAYLNKGINVSEIKDGHTSGEVNLSGLFAKLPIGKYQIRFEIDSNNGKSRTQYCNFEVAPSVEVDAVSATAWAEFAFLSAKWYPDTRPEGITFQYRKQAANDWIDVDPMLVEADDAAKTYKAEIWGLDGGTSYVFRAVSALDKETKEKNFTTESAGTIPNMGFDMWYQSGKIWYPNENSSNFYWDTANGGSDKVKIYPTNPEDSHVVSGRAAKLESKSVPIVDLAAGNIYTGKFVKAIMDPSDAGAELDWGVPFSSRPLALRGHLDYRPGTVNVNNYAGMSGKMDIANIQVFLTDWSAPFRINTADGKFVEYDTDPCIIARGTADFNATDGYIEFTIPITYKSTSRTPKYIVISASASKYGDYFTGSTSSVMYVDEFSFVYDPAELTEDQRVIVRYK